MKGAALQINITPVDVPHAAVILPHQIRTWRTQVDKIVISVETKRSAGRYGTAWEERKERFDELLREAEADPIVEVHPIDYEPEAREAVRAQFGIDAPDKDLHGAPFYGYLYGLQSTRSRYVLHADSDMLFGGASADWMAEAIAHLENDPSVLVSGPLPGPPTLDGTPRSDVLQRAARSQTHSSVGVLVGAGEIEFRHMSTRCFLVDLERLAEHALELEMEAPPRFSRTSPGTRPLEVSVSGLLRRTSMVRRDLLGRDPGMWIVHPPYRTPAFIRDLPRLVERIERGDIPDGQRGDFDLNDSMVDWRVPRRRAALQRQTARGARLAASLLERSSLRRPSGTDSPVA